MDNRPNFIVIHTDQHRYDCVGASGMREGIYTPYIDSIGWQGARFTSAYCNCPLCIPQRLSLLTGQVPSHHGLFYNVGIPYLPLQTTLPAQMRRGGYQTALVGRTMHTYPFNHSYGFEYYLPGDPSSENKESSDAFFTYLRDHNSHDCGGYEGCGSHNNSRAASPFHLNDEYHHTKWATNRAIDFLANRDQARPFMLFVGYYAPHSPHNPPEPFFNRYYQRNDLGSPYLADWDIPPASSGNVMSRYVKLNKEEVRSLYAGYYGNIAFLDTQIGRLLSVAMRQKNTYIIFTSDHGEMLGDHYRMQKNCPYQGAIHILFHIMGPGIADGQERSEPIGWHDIMPTILDLAGLPIPESVDGRSMAPLLMKDQKDVSWRNYMHGECTHDSLFNARVRPISEKHNFVYEKGSHYLTDGTMKYIWHTTSGREQLFNIREDYGELHDLSTDPAYQEELRNWRSILVQELAGREEGFSDGENLIPGCISQKTSQAIDQLVQQRKAEGFLLAFGSKANPIDKLQFEETLMK